MKDSTLCAQCRVGDHRNHNEDGCSNDNNFNADCACPVEYESWKAFVAGLTAPAPPTQPEGEQESPQPPERIWINHPTKETEHDQRWWYENAMAFPTVEYVRADIAAASSSGAAAARVAKEEHYLDLAKFGEGHENVNPEDHLSACPFCCKTELSRCWDDGLYWIRCVSCGATGPETTKRSDEDAPDWNSRANAEPATTTAVRRRNDEAAAWREVFDVVSTYCDQATREFIMKLEAARDKAGYGSS